MAAPTISSATIVKNDYITVTFSEGVYTTSSHNTPVSSSDFTVTLGGTNKRATGVTLGTFYKNDGSALTAAGGDSVIRMSLTWTGIPNGNETITITVASGTAVYNVTAEAMAAGQNTGAISASALFTIYVSKAGLDTYDGLTTSTAKLTLGGAKAILQYGNNKIWVGVGDYVETTVLDSTSKLVEIWGDYNAAIFGGSAGEVMQTTSGDYQHSVVYSFNRMTLKITGSSKYFIKDNSMDVTDVTYNYIIFRPPSGGSNFSAGAGYLQTPKKYVFNYCSLDTGNLTMNPCYWTQMVFNNFDTITAGKYLTGLQKCKDLVFNNCSVIWNSAMTESYGTPNIKFVGGTLKRDGTSTLLSTAPASTPYANDGNILIKDCDFHNSSDADINLATDTAIATCYFSDYPWMTAWKMKELAKNTSQVLFDNVNSNGKKVLFKYGGIGLDGDTETYNDKNVMYYNYTTTSGYKTADLIPIKGLAVSTAYIVSFSYKKSKNSTNANYDVRAGIANRNDNIFYDLVTTPANLETYADYTASTHTYDTWYDKTLSFTTSSDADEEYYLLILPNYNEYNFKITAPTITVS